MFLVSVLTLSDLYRLFASFSVSCNAEMQTHFSAICILAIMYLCYASFNITILFIETNLIALIFF
jgi:hypothetical protein